MVFISYNIGCRNCLQSDGIRHMYSLINGDIDEYQSKTEFEVITQIEQWREQDNHTCELCGSKNVEILEVEVSDQKLYDYDKIVERCQENNEYMLQINIDKRGSNINLNPGGSQRFEQNFLKKALVDIHKTMINRSDNQFKIHQNGNMFICVTGGMDFIESQAYTRIERFTCAGLSKVQIVNAFQEFINNIGIPVEFEVTSKSLNDFDLNFVFKSSDHLRYENGIHVSGPHGGAGRAVKVEPNINGCEGYNITGGDGYLVTIFNLDGNHPVWSNNVQMSPKPMRVLSKTTDKIVLRGYPVEAMSPFGWIDFNGQDYGLTINIKNGELKNCILHMHDKNVDIEYLP